MDGSYRSVKEDFGGKEGVVFAEVPVIENEEKLHSVIECLDGVRDTPNATISAQWMSDDRRNTHGGKNQTSPAFKSSINVSPFSLIA
jgi:hypothetical protein